MNKSKNDESKKTDEILEQHRKELGKKYWVIIQCENDGFPHEYAGELEGKYFNEKEALKEAQSISEKLDQSCKNRGYRSASIKEVITDEEYQKRSPKPMKI